MAPDAVDLSTFLTIPTELRFRVYGEVFAGSEMRLKLVGPNLLRCTNPEQYRVLRACKQIEHEAAPVLAAMTTLFVKAAGFSSRSPSEVLSCCNSSRAPRFLRQAVSHLRHMEVSLLDNDFMTLTRTLNSFVQLREVRLSTSRFMNKCIPDTIVQCPLLLLGTASDNLFVLTLKRCLRKMPLNYGINFYVGGQAVTYTYAAFKAMVNAPFDEVHENAGRHTRYDLLWQGECQLRRKSSAWEPLNPRLGHDFTMSYVANLGTNIIVSKQFTTSYSKVWTEDPREMLRRVQDQSRKDWTPGVAAQTTLPE